jgi:hypothetical protein
MDPLHRESDAMPKRPRQTPRVPRTALYEVLVPIALAVLLIALAAVLLIVLFWPAPGAG